MASLSRAQGVPSDQPQGAYYTVDINMNAVFATTNTTAGGGVTPKTQADFSTKATSLAISRRGARGQLRYKKMLEAFQTRSNVRIVNLVTTGDANGSTQITDLNFGLVFENDDFIPTTGTSADGSSTFATKVAWITDKIAETCATSFTEKMTVYDPTSGVGNIKDEEVTAAAVTTALGELVEQITVAEVAAFRSNVDAETPTDNAATSTAE